MKITLIIIFLLILSEISFGQKTDILIMDNDDKITGEIKTMNFGKLNLKTSSLGTLSIEWDKVKFIYTDKEFDFELDDGNLIVGHIDSTDIPFELTIITDIKKYKVATEKIVALAQLKSSFWEKSTGYVSVGLNYTKGTGNGQFNLTAKGAFRSKKWSTSSYLNSILSFQDDQETSKNQRLDLNLERLLPNKWVLGAQVSFEQNTELGINLRTSVIPMGGYIFSRSNKNVLWGAGGVSFNKETFTDTTQSILNLDGFAQLNYQIFIYDSPSISLNTFANIYPGFTDWGRIRSNFNIYLDWEILSDFYWNLTFYYSYDNKPTGTASTNDYGFNSSLKYVFN